MTWIVELEPGNYLLGYGNRKSTMATPSKPDAKRFNNVYRAGDARDSMKKIHGFDEARIVEVDG